MAVEHHAKLAGPCGVRGQDSGLTRGWLSVSGWTGREGGDLAGSGPG